MYATSIRKTWSESVKTTEAIRVSGQRSRARMAGTPATLCLADWQKTVSDFSGLCAYCQERTFSVLEHFLPVEVAGTTVNNCLPACINCNSKKRHHVGEKLISLFGENTISRLETYLTNRQAIDITGTKQKRGPYPPSIQPGPDAPYRTLDQAIDVLGISMNVLRYRLKKHGIAIHKFRFHRNAFITSEALEFLIQLTVSQ